ncbi:replication protein [Escherichia coli]|nr:replication protein [Escherichia coli]
MWRPVLFRFLVDSLATLGHRLAASGITSRMLSVIPVLFFWG